MLSMRDAAAKKLGTKFKPPRTIQVNDGEDRLTRIARANSGNKTVSAKARAFSGGVPSDWTPVSDAGD